MHGGLVVSDQAVAGGGFRHAAWFYRTPGGYLAGLREFVAAAQAAGEPVLVAVPASRLPAGWNRPDGQAGVGTVDVGELGRNPARMIPALRAFADEHPGQHVRVVAELAWAGRSAPEFGEVARYELMVNLAFAATRITILCPYDAARLPGLAVSAACASHPWLWQAGHAVGNADYDATAARQARLGPPLRVPPDARALSYQHDLRPVRVLVASEAARAGLSGARCTDLVIAASEVAANTLKHTRGGGVIRVWVTSDEVLCQFDDSGHIDDPLAGYGRPAGDVPGGQGLWLVNQVCDLAEIRTSAVGTTIRLHMSRDGMGMSLPDRAAAGRA